jgi:hypothetical protein
MVSFSLRQRISYLLLQDPSLVSFHLIQFAVTRRLLSPRRTTSKSKHARSWASAGC